MPAWVNNLSPYGAAVSLGVAISIYVVSKHPEKARRVAAVSWVVAGAAIGTAVAPGVGTAIGAAVGAVVAWWTY